MKHSEIMQRSFLQSKYCYDTLASFAKELSYPIYLFVRSTHRTAKKNLYNEEKFA